MYTSYVEKAKSLRENKDDTWGRVTMRPCRLLSPQIIPGGCETDYFPLLPTAYTPEIIYDQPPQVIMTHVKAPGWEYVTEVWCCFLQQKPVSACPVLCSVWPWGRPSPRRGSKLVAMAGVRSVAESPCRQGRSVTGIFTGGVGCRSNDSISLVE